MRSAKDRLYVPVMFAWVALWGCSVPEVGSGDLSSNAGGNSPTGESIPGTGVVKAPPASSEAAPPAACGDGGTCPPPSGGPPAADACVAPAGLKLQDQDLSDDQLPWKRTPGTKVTINFETNNVEAEYVEYMQKSADNWNKSPCLDVRLVDKCQSGTNCVTVRAPNPKTDGDGNFDAVERSGFTVGGHIDILPGLSKGEKLNVMIHEMGHAVGLRHRKTKHVLMNEDTYDDVFASDPIDYQNLLVLYGNQK
jgi:hypothetical protein